MVRMIKMRQFCRVGSLLFDGNLFFNQWTFNKSEPLTSDPSLQQSDTLNTRCRVLDVSAVPSRVPDTWRESQVRGQRGSQVGTTNRKSLQPGGRRLHFQAHQRLGHLEDGPGGRPSPVSAASLHRKTRWRETRCDANGGETAELMKAAGSGSASATWWWLFTAGLTSLTFSPPAGLKVEDRHTNTQETHEWSWIQPVHHPGLFHWRLNLQLTQTWICCTF